MKQTIFIVDDDPSVLSALGRALRWRGFFVETYESAQLFLDSYKNKPGGCLILDVKMPGMNGLELQQELKKQKISLPIIFITGHGGAEESDIVLRAGAVAFLEKPFSQATLIDCLTQILETDACE